MGSLEGRKLIATEKFEKNDDTTGVKGICRAWSSESLQSPEEWKSIAKKEGKKRPLGHDSTDGQEERGNISGKALGEGSCIEASTRKNKGRKEEVRVYYKKAEKVRLERRLVEIRPVSLEKGI